MSIHLTKIYTRTGDDGSTALGDFSRTSKTDSRLVAYADTDETGATIGVALSCADMPPGLREKLRRVQNDLFDVGADLCVPLKASYDYEPLRVKEEWIAELESDIDAMNEELEPLKSFILAGGSASSAHLHVARCVARRAERSAWEAIDRYGTEQDGQGVSVLTAKYLNRLSDFLFVAARLANIEHGDVLWQPGGGRSGTTT